MGDEKVEILMEVDLSRTLSLGRAAENSFESSPTDSTNCGDVSAMLVKYGPTFVPDTVT
jgi:hypothetical protein